MSGCPGTAGKAPAEGQKSLKFKRTLLVAPAEWTEQCGNRVYRAEPTINRPAQL